jgi:hypothetical protein
MLLDVMSEILFVLERPLARLAAERLAVAVTFLVTLTKFDRVQHDAAKGTSEEEKKLVLSSYFIYLLNHCA